jgi:hypothetical protein
MDIKKSEDRFTAFLAMIQEEVLADLYEAIRKNSPKQFIELMKSPEVKKVLSILIIKTMINIHDKHGLEKDFINDMFGEKVYK